MSSDALEYTTRNFRSQEGRVRDPHLTPELLQASVRGEVEDSVILRIAYLHFSRLCPICDEVIDAARREFWRGKRGIYRTSMLVKFLVDRFASRVKCEQEKALDEIKILLRYDREVRFQEVKDGKVRFRGTGVARLLIAESERQLLIDPVEATHLAELSYRVLLRDPYGMGDFRTLSLSFVAKGMGHLALGELKEARQAFELVRAVLATWEEPEPEVVTRVEALGTLLGKELDLDGFLREHASKENRARGEELQEEAQ